MSGGRSEIALTVNGERRRRRGRGSHHAGRLPARGAGPDRDPRRLRGRLLRRLHRPPRRQSPPGPACSSRSRPRAARSRRSSRWPSRMAAPSAAAGVCRHHGLQCGFCTPGMLMAALEFVESWPPGSPPSDEEIRCGSGRETSAAARATRGSSRRCGRCLKIESRDGGAMGNQLLKLSNHVGGAAVDAVEGETREILNPATGAVIGRVPECAEADVERAVEAAARRLPGLARHDSGRPRAGAPRPRRRPRGQPRGAGSDRVRQRRQADRTGPRRDADLRRTSSASSPAPRAAWRGGRPASTWRATRRWCGGSRSASSARSRRGTTR